MKVPNPIKTGHIKEQGSGSSTRVLLAAYKWICSHCGKLDYNDNLPPGWEQRSSTSASALIEKHLCTRCKLL
jgi:hypothetical protein